MTTIHKPKLTAAISTLAILAPAASAQAGNNWRAVRITRHFAITQPERHFRAHHANRPAIKFQRDGRSWG